MPITITRKKTLINVLPLTMANLAPSVPPAALQTAMGIAIAYIIRPLLAKNKMEPRLVARLTSFACALAFKKSKPSKVIKASTRKLPAPGPTKPS